MIPPPPVLLSRISIFYSCVGGIPDLPSVCSPGLELPLACNPSRGKMTKVGHVLGINDAAAAATLQKEMTVLARKQDEEIIRRQKLGGLGSWKSSTKSAATESQELSSTAAAAADPQGNRRQSSSTTLSCSQEQQQVMSDSVSGKGQRSRNSSHGCASPTSSAAAASGEGGPAEEKRSKLSRLRRHRGDKDRSSSSCSSSSSSRRARGGSGVSTSSAPRSHAGSHDLAAWEEGGRGGTRGTPAAAAAAVEALEGAAPAGEAVDKSDGGNCGAASGPGRGPSSGLNLDHCNGERPSSGGRGDDPRKGSPTATRPRSSESASRPGPTPDGGDNANKADAEPDATVADGDGAAGCRHQGGGGDDGVEAKEKAAGEAAETRPLPLPAPLATKRSWEHDDVGDLFDSVDGNDNVAKPGLLVAAEGSAGVVGEERHLGENGVGNTAPAAGGSSSQGESASLRGEAGGEGRGVRSAGGHSSLPPTPPVGRALELDGGSRPEEKDTPTSVPKSSRGMPWGGVVFRSNTTESPGGNSMNSTAGVLGLGTSSELRDVESGSAAVTDDDGGGYDEAHEKDGVRGWEEAGVGAAAAGRAALAGVDSTNEDDADDFASKAATGEEEPLQPLPEGGPTGGGGSVDGDDSGVVVPLPKVGDGDVGDVVVEDEEEEAGGAAETVEAAAAETADVAEEEVRLTAAFHAHLTPALCEVRGGGGRTDGPWQDTTTGSCKNNVPPKFCT